MPKSSATRWLQIALLLAIAAALVRLAVIIHVRSRPAVRPSAVTRSGPLNPEVYVVARKLYPYDLNSARRLTQQPVWIKEGYRYTYYPYDAARHRADFEHEAGLLGPIEKLRISDVVMQPTPGAPKQRQVLAIFTKPGGDYAVPVGMESGGDYRIYADEMFFYEDPHQLYKFWPAQIWQQIHDHQVKPGMDEIQAAFAVGMGIPQPGDPQMKVVKYPNGGHPITVTYEDGKAVEVKPGS